MCKSVLNRRVGLLPAPHAFQPVDHVSRVVIAHSRWWRNLVAIDEDVLDRPPAIYIWIIFMVSGLLDHLPTWAAFSSMIQQSCFLSHNPREPRGVVAEAG